MNALAQHPLALGRVVRRFVREPWSSLLTLIVIGVALSLPLGLYALVDNVRLLAGRLNVEPQITVFMAANAGADSARQIETRLKAMDGIRQLRFIPRDQALQELLQGAGLGDVTAGLERNPLPDAFIIEPRSTAPAALEKLRDELAKLPRVDNVQLDTIWAKRLGGIVRLGRDIALLLALLLGFALVAITSNTIRLQILSQREEIEVSKLIGATDSFIRRPFLYHGLLQGLVGGLAAWLIVSLGLLFLNAGIDDLARLYGAEFRLQGPAGGEILGLLLFSAGLGWLGAFLAVGQHLRQIEPRG